MRNIIYFFTKLFWCHCCLVGAAAVTITMESCHCCRHYFRTLSLRSLNIHRRFSNMNGSWVVRKVTFTTATFFLLRLFVRSLKRKYIFYTIAFDDGMWVIYTYITLTSTQEISFNCFLVLQKTTKQNELSTRCETTVIFYSNSLWVGNKNYDEAFSLQRLKAMNSFESINGKATRKEWCGFSLVIC